MPKAALTVKSKKAVTPTPSAVVPKAPPNGVFAPFEQAQSCREWLAGRKAIDTSKRIEKDAEGLYLPILPGVLAENTKLRNGCKFVTRSFEEKPARGGLKERLVALGIVKEDETDELVASFDIIGSIAIVLVRPALQAKKKAVALAILDTHPSVTTVLEKTGGREGEWRATKVEWLAGKKTTITVHRESGVSMKLDVKSCYFSPRLSTERLRLSNLIQPGSKERVVVPFAGVGPFVLVIAKAHPDATVAGIELNPTATNYFKINIQLNKLTNAFATYGDAKKELAKKEFCGCADRVIAPLPHTAKDFLPELIGVLKKGGTLHYYGFVPTAKKFGETFPGEPPQARFQPLIDDIVNEAKKQGRKAFIHFAKTVRPYSAAQDQAVIDARIE